ncbi:MAG: hypothetical protein ABIC57_03705 [bacterium]
MANNNQNQNSSSTSGFVKFPSPQDDSAPIKPKTSLKPVKPISKPSIPTKQDDSPKSKQPFSFQPNRLGDFGFPSMSGGMGNNGNGDKSEIIKKAYQDILGKEPEPRDISYYRFSPMGEEEIRQQLVTGKEHKDLLEKGNKYSELKDKLETSQAKVKVLEGKINDQLEEFNQLHNLLKEKNRYIRQLRLNSAESSVEVNSCDNNQFPIQNDESKVQKPTVQNIEPSQQITPIETVEPPDPPLPHFTDDTISHNPKKKGFLDNIFRS